MCAKRCTYFRKGAIKNLYICALKFTNHIEKNLKFFFLTFRLDIFLSFAALQSRYFVLYLNSRKLTIIALSTFRTFLFSEHLSNTSRMAYIVIFRENGTLWTAVEVAQMRVGRTEYFVSNKSCTQMLGREYA